MSEEKIDKTSVEVQWKQWKDRWNSAVSDYNVIPEEDFWLIFPYSEEEFCQRILKCSTPFHPSYAPELFTKEMKPIFSGYIQGNQLELRRISTDGNVLFAPTINGRFDDLGEECLVHFYFRMQGFTKFLLGCIACIAFSISIYFFMKPEDPWFGIFALFAFAGNYWVALESFRRQSKINKDLLIKILKPGADYSNQY